MTEEMLKGLAMELFDGQEKVIIPQFDIHAKKTLDSDAHTGKILELDFTKPF